MNHSNVFTQVDYRSFRRYLAGINTPKIRERGYETVICDRHGEVQAIVHAAAIDERGRCHPAGYYVLSSNWQALQPQAA